jgi:hypothetical protein
MRTLNLNKLAGVESAFIHATTNARRLDYALDKAIQDREILMEEKGRLEVMFKVRAWGRACPGLRCEGRGADAGTAADG